MLLILPLLPILLLYIVPEATGTRTSAFSVHAHYYKCDGATTNCTAVFLLRWRLRPLRELQNYVFPLIQLLL